MARVCDHLRVRLALGAWLVVSLAVPIAASRGSALTIAQIGSGESFQQADWDSALAQGFPRGVVIEYRQTLHATMAAPAIDALAREVEGHPDHPDRLRLSIEQRRLAAPDVIEFRVWVDGRSRWRYNRTDHGLNFWSDIAIDGDVGWSLTRDSLMIVSNAQPPENRDLASTGGQIAGQLRTMISGDIGAAPATVSVPAGGSSPTRAEFDVRYENSLVRRYLVERSSPDEPWRTTRWVATECPSAPGAVGTSKVFAGWHFEPTLNAWIARRAQRLDLAGRPVEELELIGLEPATSAELSAVLAIPTAEGVDVVRGPSSIRTIFDYRPDHGVVLTYGAGPPTSRPIPGLAEEARLSSAWRVIGWVLAAALASTLVALRYIARRARARVRNATAVPLDSRIEP